MKKTYITLRDRQWKGKDWFTSFRSYKNTRKLTEKESEPLLKEGTIQEVEELKKPIIGVVATNDGRMFCLKCKSTKGFYIFKMRRGKQQSWYNMYKCAECGEREKKLINN